VFYLAPGNTFLQWRYSKDAATNAGLDAAWVDEVTFITNPPPIVLTSVGATGIPPEGFSFDLSAAPGAALVIEASTNLTVWTPLVTNVMADVPFHFSESATNFDWRFYRARAQ
jgi:hypothetical protein